MKYDFNPIIAKDIWVEEAIMYANIKWWCEHNIANKKNYYDWLYWTYNSYPAFAILFPFWTEKQIKRILDNLEKKWYIKIWEYNKQKYDRTKRYSAVYDLVLSIWPNGQMDMTEWSDGDDQIGSPIPDSKPDSKPNKKPNINKEEESEKEILIPSKNTLGIINPPIAATPRKEKELVIKPEKIIENLKSEWRLAYKFPNIDEQWLKIEILSMLDWAKSKKREIKIRKTFIDNWYTDKTTNARKYYKRIEVKKNIEIDYFAVRQDCQ